MSPSGCQLSQLTQLATPSSPTPHTASSLLTFHFQACLGLFSEREHPPPHCLGCQVCSLGLPAVPFGHHARWPGGPSLRTIQMGCNGELGI